MNRKTLIIVGIQAFIIVVLFWLLIFYGRDEYEELIGEEEEEIETPSLVVTGNEAKLGAATIRLSEVAQKESGILTSPLIAASHMGQSESYGSVLALDTLFDLRSRYLSALAEVNIARSAIPSTRQLYERSKLLNEDNKNVSDQALNEAEASFKNAQARLSAAESNASGLRDQLKQQWGEAFIQPNSSLLESLSRQQMVIVQVSLPEQATAPKMGSTLDVSPVGSASTPSKARFLSVATQSDPTVIGRTYLFTAPAEHLRAGMRLSVRLTDSASKTEGVIVPDTAVVWYANKAWIYQKEGKEFFVRKEINTDIEANNDGDNGWFNAGRFRAGELVVTSGAQLLLSEEFKSQITNENDD